MTGVWITFKASMAHALKYNQIYNSTILQFFQNSLNIYTNEDYSATTVRTLTLTAGALKLNVFPVLIVLLTGTIKFGLVGVLLAVLAPVRT